MMDSQSMPLGFNTDVMLGEAVYHVQTEACWRGEPAIESSIFFRGLVQLARRAPLPHAASSPAAGALVRQSHAQIIEQLRSGQLRASAKDFKLDCAVREEALAENRLKIEARTHWAGMPLKLARVLLAGGETHTDCLAEQITEADGAATLECSIEGVNAAARYLVRAQYGLCQASCVIEVDGTTTLKTRR